MKMNSNLSSINIGDLVKIVGRSKLPLERLMPYLVLDIEVDKSCKPFLYEFKLLRSVPLDKQNIFYWCNQTFSSHEKITKRMTSKV